MALRLTLVADTSVDVAMLLREVMMPLPMREGWGESVEWPYPGIPAAVVVELVEHRVAMLPFFTPETITTDHGNVYKNHHLVEVQRVIEANILPSRVLRPTDKQTIERAFGALRALLFEHLLGYPRRATSRSHGGKGRRCDRRPMRFRRQIGPNANAVVAGGRPKPWQGYGPNVRTRALRTSPGRWCV